MVEKVCCHIEITSTAENCKRKNMSHGEDLF